jgi:antirestriction protein
LDQYSDDGHEASAIGYLLDIMHLDEAIKRRDEVILHGGSLTDYAFELVENICSLDQLPELIRKHIDYDSIARDLELNSEVTELSRNVWVVNCLEF